MPERYKYEHVADIFLSVCYICSTIMDLSIIFFAEFFVLYKTLFLAVHPMCYVHILHSNTNSWLHTQQVT
jgi:hypothetical protein